MSRPSIVIVGLLPKQVTQVTQACKKLDADLRFITQYKERADIPQADHCVLMVKFVGHRWTDKALKQFPRNRVHYSMGGTSKATETINGIVSGIVTHGSHHTSK